MKSNVTPEAAGSVVGHIWFNNRRKTALQYVCLLKSTLKYDANHCTKPPDIVSEKNNIKV